MRAFLLFILCLVPSQAPAHTIPSIVVGFDEHEPEWKHPIRVVRGYVRVDAVLVPDQVVAQAYVSQGAALVDVFNVGNSPVRLAFKDAEGDPGEYDREVLPGCGIAWSSSAPSWRVDAEPSQWDALYAPKPWHKVDDGWTFMTGSPRNRFFSPHVWRAQGGLSRDMEVWLDRYVRWQLQRSYQSPDPVRALPRALTGHPHIGGEWTRDPLAGTITPMDTHHQTVGVLRDAYLLTGNPRALDQIVREITWALASQDYYRTDWPWPYGGIERVPGWLLVSLADAAECFKRAGLQSLVETMALHAEAHVRLLETIGFNEEGLPRIISAADGRHLEVPHNLPWQGSIVAFGLYRVHKVLGVPGARELGDRYLDYVENHGWDGKGVVYDSIPHYPEDDVGPRSAGVPGIGMWPAASLIEAGRRESPLLRYLVERSQEVKVSGQPLLSGHTDAGLSWFGPLVPAPE